MCLSASVHHKWINNHLTKDIGMVAATFTFSWTLMTKQTHADHNDCKKLNKLKKLLSSFNCIRRL